MCLTPCAEFAMLHTTADAETFRAAHVRQGGRLDPDADAARFWMVSDILDFLRDLAHILVSLASSRLDLSIEVVRRRLEDLLALRLAEPSG